MQNSNVCLTGEAITNTRFVILTSNLEIQKWTCTPIMKPSVSCVVKHSPFARNISEKLIKIQVIINFTPFGYHCFQIRFSSTADYWQLVFFSLGFDQNKRVNCISSSCFMARLFKLTSCNLCFKMILILLPLSLYPCWWQNVYLCHHITTDQTIDGWTDGRTP